MKKRDTKLTKVIPYEVMKAVIKTTPKLKELDGFIKDYIDHFKKDKWPIRVDHVVCDMFSILTGVDPCHYFVDKLAKKDIYLGIGDKNGTVFYLDEKKKAKKKVSKKKR